MTDRPTRFTRKDFLKITGLGLMAAGASNIVDKLHIEVSRVGASVRSVEAFDFHKEKVTEIKSGSDDYYVYTGLDAVNIERVKKEYGIKMACPKKWNWGEESNFSWESNERLLQLNGLQRNWNEEKTLNIQWTGDELASLVSELNDLPPSYLHTKNSVQLILLLKKPTAPEHRNSEGGIGGGYTTRQVLIFTEEGSDYKANLIYNPEAELFFTQGLYEGAVLIHEFTHDFQEAHPEELLKWEKDMGWTKESEMWVNDQSMDLWHLGNADIYPWEHMAVAAMIFAYNPVYLTPRERQFFLDDQYYASWWKVIEYKKEHPEELNNK